jgi:hypothetical protein
VQFCLERVLVNSVEILIFLVKIPITFVTLIKKGGGNGPLKPWQPVNSIFKVPKPSLVL